MALGAQLPSWLNQPNFLGAMEAGASTGLRARQQDIEEYQAADRLKLAYDQLAKQERVASMQALAKQKQGEAALALRAAIAQQGMDLRERSLQQQGDLRSRALDIQQSRLDSEGKSKDYGEPQTMDLGDGNKFIYRKGSPGGHLLTSKDEKGLTPSAAATLYGKLPELDYASGTAGTTNSLAATLGPQLRDVLQGSIKKKQPVNQEFVPDTSQAAPAPAKKKRVKVKGPSGQTGTIEEGDTLPDGWKLLQ